MYKAFSKLCKKDEANQQSLSFIDLFRTPRLRQNTMLIIILWMAINLTCDGHVRNIENLDFSIYASFTITAFLELPADLLSIVGINHLGRRWSSAISLALSGVFMLPCAWIQGCWMLNIYGLVLSSIGLNSR